MKIAIKQAGRNNYYKLYYQVRHGEQKALIDTNIKVLLPITKTDGGIGFTLDRKEPSMRLKLKRLEALYWELDEFILLHPNLRPVAIKTAFCGQKSPKGKCVLAKAIRDHADSGKVADSTAAILKRTADKVEKYDPKAGFDIDEDWLDKFCRWLKENGTKVNGIAIHLRNIRTGFNYARRKKLTKEYPFLDYKIKEERQPIRNMTSEQIREFSTYPCEAWQVEYRDIFMLSFYLAGVNIGDLLQCRKLENGRFVYRRAKTGKIISLPVHPEAMAIINKYAGTQYLLNMCDRYKDYHGYLHKINDGLKKIGVTTIVKDKVGKLRKHEVQPFYDGLSTYVARYTWASVAAECGVERDIIAACLGHSWADVTSHYIAYSQKMMDEAVMKVADYVVTGEK